MSLNVLLIRHGQSEWNEAGRWQGQQDPPLTEAGRNDARAAARVRVDGGPGPAAFTGGPDAARAGLQFAVLRAVDRRTGAPDSLPAARRA